MAQSYSLLGPSIHPVVLLMLTLPLPVKSVTGIDWKPGWLRSLYVAIDVDATRVHRTHPKKKAEDIWNELATLPSSIITLQLFSDPALRKDRCLAKKEIELAVLLEMCGLPGETKGMQYIAVALDHTRKTAAATPEPVLVVCMTALGRFQAGDIVIANATEDVAALQGLDTRSQGLEVMDRAAQSSGLLYALGTLVSRVEVVVKIGAEIAKIHPYANAAWQVLTAVHNVPSCRNGSYLSLTAARVLTQVISKDEEKIEEFTAVFGKLQQSLGTRLELYTASASTKILEIVLDSGPLSASG
ncbi:hypothetical protein C8F04DRAFT_1182409 [Mycena alexandri]|uniref:Uncharacterized protein n=1 Tax=Mycena alexandri TaxID=1745969 RepID=A0AAD6X3F3_9AGAR|nr:hypothetical protein C8F04DRAFT_1182409 [Mycena alexandri]